MSRRTCFRAAATALTALAAIAVSASTASAGVLVASAPPCTNQPLSQPFAPWQDYANYTPLLGGNFESAAAGWSLSAGASVAAGNSSYAVGGAQDASSLALSAGASATSPSICVTIDHPVMRFFAKRRSTGLLANLSTLRVDVLFELSTGALAALPIGVVLSDGSWQPTPQMLTIASVLALQPGENTAVAFRFTAQGGDWSVDDVYVDPYMRK